METYSNLEKLSNDLKNLFQNQNEEESYFDFEIICEQNQTSFKTHKSILSSRNVSSSILSSILNYFYSGKIKINLENAIQILIFSSKYLIDELIGISLNFIKNHLQIETIVDILKLSETMNLNKLLNSSYKFIFENFDKFIKTPFFLELEENHLNSILSNYEISIDEFELFQSIIKWGKHKSNINQEKDNQKLKKEEKEKLQDQISNVIDKIRFIDFTKQELKDILKEDLIPEQISQKLIQFQKLQENENELNQFIEKELKDFIEKENGNENSFIFKPKIGLNCSTIIQEKEHFNKIREWINDDKFFSKMRLGFSTQRDGFNCFKWHDICDDQGKTLVIIKTKDNFIFGGFTSVGFISNDVYWSKIFGESGYIEDENAFLFSLRNDKNDRKPEKFPVIYLKHRTALFYQDDIGPTFGKFSSDLFLDEKLKTGGTNFGRSYDLPYGIKYGTNEAKSYLAGSYDKWEVDELETFFI
ncbi:btb/poz domain-containing protein [Anaeramoeba ignava]|uniref:Btb/poz domain-containing protein n=1 Tax=Anaeramoeba ignava TaxID=1746090 RepID=A0A9Q0L7M6_ANAIG|nr:btb/poz domain-containing protein [Anaeramoeba ignava]